MAMRKLYIYFIWSLTSNVSAAQAPDTSMDNRRLANGYWLKINVLSFYDPGAPTIQIGVERKFNPRNSIEMTVGIPIKIKKNLKNTDSTYVRYYKIKAEVKFFSAKKPLHYLAPDLFYTKFSFNQYAAIFIRDGAEYVADYAEFRKSIFGAALKSGYLVKNKKTGKINSDFSAGVGIRLLNTQIDDINSVPFDHHHHPWSSMHPKEGWKITPHFSLAIKVYFKL